MSAQLRGFFRIQTQVRLDVFIHGPMQEGKDVLVRVVEGIVEIEYPGTAVRWFVYGANLGPAMLSVHYACASRSDLGSRTRTSAPLYKMRERYSLLPLRVLSLFSNRRA